MYLPSLAAELPDGWTVSEGSVFTSPSGTEVRVQLSRAEDGRNASDLVEGTARTMQAEFKPVEEISASTIELPGGRFALERRFRFGCDGSDNVGRIVCTVDGSLVLTVSASWPETGGDGDGAMTLLLESLRLLHRPVATFGELRDHASEHDPKKRVNSEPPDWSALREAWSGSSPREAELRHVSRWSPEELAVCATVLGSPLFPTVGIELLGSLSKTALDATLQTVTRSFVARGLLRSTDDGSAALVGDVGEMMDTAVNPGLTILIQRVGANRNEARWFGVRHGSAVQVEVLHDGSRECAALEPACLVGHVLASARKVACGRDGTVVETGIASRRVTLDDVIEGSSPIDSLVVVNTAWRVGDQIWGGVLTWAVGADGLLWSTEQEAADGEAPPSWTLRTAEAGAVRAELLEHLPGA